MFFRFFMIFFCVIVSSCATSTNPRNTSYKIDEICYIHPFISDWYPGTIFLYNPNSKPQLQPIHNWDWIQNVPGYNKNKIDIMTYLEYRPIREGFSIESTWKGIGASADTIFIEGEIGYSSNSVIAINVSEGRRYMINMGPHELIFMRWKETDPTSFNEFVMKLNRRRQNRIGDLVIVEFIALATKGSFFAKFEDKIVGKLKENVIEKIDLYGGYIKAHALYVEANPQNPMPYEWQLKSLDLDKY